MDDLEKLKLFCKRFEVRPRHLQRAFDEEAKIAPRTVRAFMSGETPFPELDNDAYMRVLSLAARYRRLELTQVLPSEKEMRSDNTWKRNRAKRLKQADILKKREPELPIFGSWPTLKAPLTRHDKEQLSFVWRATFDSLPIERTYILGTDFDTLAMLTKPELSTFYELITQLNPHQKTQAKKVIEGAISIVKVKDILRLLDSKEIQQWRRFAKYDYRKVFVARLSSEKRKHKEQTESEIVSKLRDEAWDRFYAGLLGLDFWRYDTPTLLMEHASILDNRAEVKLVLGFLCCLSWEKGILDWLRNQT